MAYTHEQFEAMSKALREGRTWVDLAVEYGSKPDTLRMAHRRHYERQGGQANTKANRKKTLPAHARATKEANTEPNRTEQPNTEPNTLAAACLSADVEVLPAVSRATTIDELAGLLKMAKNGYERASKIVDDEQRRTWMETSYMKIMKDCIVLMGKWCGLDNTLTEDRRSRLITRADIDRMDRDTMHAIVIAMARRDAGE